MSNEIIESALSDKLDGFGGAESAMAAAAIELPTLIDGDDMAAAPRTLRKPATAKAAATPTAKPAAPGGKAPAAMAPVGKSVAAKAAPAKATLKAAAPSARGKAAAAKPPAPPALRTATTVKSKNPALIRITCSDATRRKEGFGAPEYDFIFEDASAAFVPEGTFSVWREAEGRSGKFVSARGGKEVTLAELVRDAQAAEVNFLQGALREMEVENYKLRDLFYNSSAKVRHLNEHISNSGLYRDYLFVEIPPVDYVPVGLSSVIEQRLVRVPVGASKLSLFAPLSAKGAALKCTVTDSLTGKTYFAGSVEIKSEGWFTIEFWRPVSDAQNSLVVTIVPYERKGGQLETVSLAFSSRFRTEMASTLDGGELQSPLAYRVTCGPPVGSASVSGGNWFVGRNGGQIGIADAARNTVVLQSNTVKRVLAKAGERTLELGIDELEEPVILVIREPIVRSVIDDCMGRLNGVILEIEVVNNGGEDVTYRAQVLIRSSKTGRVIEEPSAVYSLKSGWRLPMLSPVTSNEEFDVLFRLVPSAPAKNVTIVIHAIRGVSFA